MSFEYIQAKNGELFKKAFHFSESLLKDGERLIYSTEEKPAREYIQWKILHARKIESSNNLTFEIKNTSFGNPAFLIVKQNGQALCRFYFNMTGYNQDFDLINERGVYYGFNEKGKSTQIREFKTALKTGFVYLVNYEK